LKHMPCLGHSVALSDSVRSTLEDPGHDGMI
jgi:hypothetical protein